MRNQKEKAMVTSPAETRRRTPSEFQLNEKQLWIDKLKPAAGSVFEIPELPGSVPLDVLKKFSGDVEHVGVRSIPKLDVGTLDDLKRMDVDVFLSRIEERYSGLRVYDSLSNAEKNDHTVGRLLEKWYWKKVKEGRINFPEIYNKGGWYVMEVMPKPMYCDSYERTMITDELGHTNRFNVTWNETYRDIIRNKSKILSRLGLPSNLTIRMPTAAELSMFLNLMEVGTDTYEWTEDEYHGVGESYRVIVGDSDLGGAARAHWRRPVYSGDYIGFRVAVVLGT